MVFGTERRIYGKIHDKKDFGDYSHAVIDYLYYLLAFGLNAG